MLVCPLLLHYLIYTHTVILLQSGGLMPAISLTFHSLPPLPLLFIHAFHS